MESTAIIHVPFRCPDCGDSIKFESLKDLRLHLQAEHSDLTIKTQSKFSPFPPSLFSNSRSATPILEMYHADAVRIEDDLLTLKRKELNNKQKRMNSISPNRVPNIPGVNGSRSSLRQLDRHNNQNPASFRQYGHSSRLEHKHFNHSKVDRGIKLKTHTITTAGNKYLDDDIKDDESLNDVTRPDISIPRIVSRQINKIHNVSSPHISSKNVRNSNVSNTLRIPESVSSDMDNHVKETLTSLSQEVVLTRANQQAAVDSLFASQEVYSSLEHIAQEKMCKQQEIIASLALKLSEKDEKLADFLVQMNSLRNKTAEEDVKNLLRMKSNQDSEKMLQEELFYKQKELASLTQRVENAKMALLKSERKNENEDNNFRDKDNMLKSEKEINLKPTKDDGSGEDNQQEKEYVSFPVNQARLVEKDMLAKEKELVSLRSKSIQLESDRQNLLLEMQGLLEVAASDNEKLRAELANQGKQLSKLNLELERSKQEQSELLGETNTLYFQADFSLSRLKHVLEERDSQLSSVSAQLEQAKEMQARLTKEREEYLNVAVEKEASYQVLVQENALQIKIMKESLDRSQLEKEKLQEKLKDMKNELMRKEKEDVQMERKMREMESQLADQEAWQVSMKEQIKGKEERLHSAKKSLDQMNSFMSDTANKELEARSKLEVFISSLIDRSSQTEAELKKLRDAYEAKEDAFKKLIEAQQAQLNSKAPYFPAEEEILPSSRSSWQREAQAEIKNLSSYPSPITARRLNGLSYTNAPNEIVPPLSPPYHNPHYHPLPSNDEETREPTRLRSTIDQVNKMEAVPERQLKNRPILVLGKEYPHPSAYGEKRSQSQPTNNRNVNTPPGPGPSAEERDGVYQSNRNPKRTALHKDQFYLPAETDEYTITPAEFRQVTPETKMAPINSLSTNSYNQMLRNRDTSPHRLNNYPLFVNTPEVERMYQNVQKHSYSSNPRNQLPKKNLTIQDHPHSRGQNFQLPMDDQGIIWGPQDRSGLRARAQKKKIKRKTNIKPSKRDNLNKNSDPGELKGYADSDDEVPSTQKKTGRSKSSQPPFLQSPAPLGDKIALLLTSMGPSSVTSNARREYERYPTITTSRPNNERDINLSYSASESDSQHSSPIHDARAVRERVEKLTARQNHRDDNRDKAVSPLPRTRKTMKNSTEHDYEHEHRALLPSRNASQYINYDNYTHQPNNNIAFMEGDEKGSKENMSRDYLNRKTFQNPNTDVYNSRDASVFDKTGLDFKSVPEKPMEGYDKDVKYNQGANTDVMSHPIRPSIEVVNVSDEQRRGHDEAYGDSYTMPPPPPAIDAVDGVGYQSSLLNPNALNREDHCESHNAESDFSSSSYATLHPGKTLHHADDAEYTAEEQDTLEDVSNDEVDESIEPNAREVFAEIHRELESRGSVDATAYQNNQIPSARDAREMFQRSPMTSRESYFSRSSSNQTSFQRNDSLVKSNSYDSVMKELLEKHPFIKRDSQEQERNSTPENDDVTAESESSEYGLNDEKAEEMQHEVMREEANPVQSGVQEYDASENNYLSSDDYGDNDDDDYDDESVRSRVDGGTSSHSRCSSRADTMDASTDTDLEKLATPGAVQRPLGGGKKKKKSGGSWAKKDKNKRQRAAAPKLKDMVKNSWTSVDANDSEEADREERLIKRRVRVALFCALAYADTKTLLSASQVCKDWRKIAHHPALWKYVKLKDSQISSQFLITLSQWCTQAQTLSLQGLTGRKQRLMESEDDYRKSIRGSLEQGLERLLFSCQGTLKSLTIEGCENILTDKCMWLVSSNCRMLSHLTYRSRVDPVNPQLMWALGGGCPGISSLYVQPYPDTDSTSKNAMNNRCLLQIGQFYRDLKEVGLGGMEFTIAGLLPFIQSCQHLTSIHMDSCVALTDDLTTALCRAGIKDLQNFTITGTAFQAKAITTLHTYCRHLKKIHATVTPLSCGFDMQKRKEKNEYKKLIKEYKDLKKKAGLSHILTLDILEVE